MDVQLQILAIVGSLRRGSYNRMLARAAAEEVPKDTAIEFADIGGIPIFNEDLREEDGEPEPVVRLVAAIRDTDALLIVSPEYNHSMPGTLKNAIDWASYGSNHPFKGKPTAVMGASTGRFGTVRMQAHLRLVLAGLGTQVVPRPEVIVSAARDKFDESGRLTDERTRRQVRLLVAALVQLARSSHQAGC